MIQTKQGPENISGPCLIVESSAISSKESGSKGPALGQALEGDLLLWHFGICPQIIFCAVLGSTPGRPRGRPYFR
jgi:hypothetical protein